MKKLLSLWFFTQTLSVIAADPDLVKGVDFTGSTSATAAKLNQLVDNAYVGGNRGMVIYTNVAPDVVTEPKLKRYLWLDTGSVPPLLKQYNTNGTPGWAQVAATATVAANSITAAMMQANSVNTSNLIDASVVATKIADATITGAKIAAGTVTTTNIAASTITSANIASGGIVGVSLATGSVTGDKIAAGSIGLSSLTNGFALQGTNIAVGTITSTNLAALSVGVSNIVVAGTSNQVLSISTDGTAVQWRTPIRTHSYSGVNANTISTDGTRWRLTFAHTLPGTPKEVRPVVVCTSADGTFNVDDEIPLAHIISTGGSGIPFTVMANATNIYVMYYTTDLGTFGKVLSQTASPAAYSLDTSKWKVKVYATY